MISAQKVRTPEAALYSSHPGYQLARSERLSLVAVRPFATQCEQFYTVLIVALSLSLRAGLAMQYIR